LRQDTSEDSQEQHIVSAEVHEDSTIMPVNPNLEHRLGRELKRESSIKPARSACGTWGTNLVPSQGIIDEIQYTGMMNRTPPRRRRRCGTLCIPDKNKEMADQLRQS
jgi:hypothetical protein